MASGYHSGHFSRPLSDDDYRNLEKMAEYVARNGPEFLELTKERLRDNPSYAFLWPNSQYHALFLQKLQQHRHQHVAPRPLQQPPPPPPPMSAPPPLNAGDLNGQNAILAQIVAALTSPGIPSEVVIAGNALALSVGGTDRLSEFAKTLQAVMHDCSQTNIHANTSWVSKNCSTAEQYDLFVRFLVATAAANPGWKSQLAVLYLVNDIVFNNESRNRAWATQAMLVHLGPLLGLVRAAAGGDVKHLEKIEKVLGLWESKGVMHPNVVQQLRLSAQGIAVPQMQTMPVGPAGWPPLNAANPYPPSNIPPQLDDTQIGASGPIFPTSVALPQSYSHPPPPPPAAPPASWSTISHPPPQTNSGWSTLPPAPQSAMTIPSPKKPIPHTAAPFTNHTKVGPPPPPPAQHQPPPSPLPIPKKHYELPAALMLTTYPHPPPSAYTPIPISKIHPRRFDATISPALSAAIDDFYKGLDVIHTMVQKEMEKGGEFEEKDNEEKEAVVVDGSLRIGKDGWEVGYLADWYAKVDVLTKAREVREKKEGGGVGYGGSDKRKRSSHTRSPSPTHKQTPSKPANVGYNLLKKLGWSEGTGLGSQSQGIATPILAHEASGDRHAGLGASGAGGDEAGMFEHWRKAKSYNYGRERSGAAEEGRGVKRKEGSGCFKCGRAGHIARECDGGGRRG
ncbi:uncharacterized protein EV422DRAFT_565833 [Fimicolochytrium jonesii]|uniref:uncharacterized protein n=1 Tax=Fimicolochytrium jonesii TaxID=1396493 RepID=UPI0022FDD419|nr:uncharacterized protein EV422DRAFT_565833 [Fimicolochytrium jonesii]KAI8822971.1 hypothetical protein EV422DRAFT_565833 [Fimicolochytrium jonesii]